MKEKVLRKSLLALLNDKNAHLSLTECIKGLNPKLRNERPANGVHSVWELVEHIRISQMDIVEYIFNPGWKSPKWPDKYWPNMQKVISDSEWNESLKIIEDGTAALSDLIKDEKIDLTSIIPHTKSHTYLREILLTADHNSYHIAQIVVVRKLLNNW